MFTGVIQKVSVNFPQFEKLVIKRLHLFTLVTVAVNRDENCFFKAARWLTDNTINSVGKIFIGKAERMN